MASRIREYFEKSFSSFRTVPSNNLFSIYYPRLPSWMDSNLTPAQQDYNAIKGDWEKTVGNLEKSVNETKPNKK